MDGMPQTKVAIVSENTSLQEQILYLLEDGFSARLYPSGEDAISAFEKEIPAIIVSDLSSPNINSIELCKTLRKNFLFRHVPVVLLVPEQSEQEKEKFVYSGIDDYVDSSRLESDLLLRIKLNLFRIARQQDINPLTHLPGQGSLLQELQKRIEAKSKFAGYCADLHRLKEYNQRYGFKKGDEVIKYTASLLMLALKQMGSPSDFLSHPSNDDFYFLTQPDSIQQVCEWVIREFDKNVSSFYDPEDVKRGHIILKNRKGEILKIPFLRLYMGVATNETYAFTNPGQVIQVATELKDYARSFQNSIFVKDRRKSYSFQS